MNADLVAALPRCVVLGLCAMSRQPRLTLEMHRQIAAAIRAGGFPHIAAQAFGVPQPVWDVWLRRGTAPGAREPTRSLVQEVHQAHAQARLKAEISVHGEAPRIWLEHGPGRDRADCPGWAGAVQAAPAAGERNPLLEPGTLELIHYVKGLLDEFPEPRARFDQMLVQTFKTGMAA
jgi:hypothetical protein